MDDRLLRELFGRTEIHSTFQMWAPQQAIVKRIERLEEYSLGGRFFEPKPKVGPRGGEGNRAKTKAARKANLRRRTRR